MLNPRSNSAHPAAGQDLRLEDDFHRTRLRGGEIAFIIGFWAVLAALVASSRMLDPRWSDIPQQGVALREILRALVNFGAWALLTPAIFWFGSRLAVERSNWRTHVPLHLAVALVVAITTDLFDDYTRIHVLPIPGGRSHSFDPMRHIYRLWFLNELIIYIAVLAAAFARDYFLRYRARQQEADRLRAQLAEARLETLRMQLNPHFLFNTLHAVSSLVERDPRGVRKMIARLSALLRYSLEGASAQEVPLRDELGFLRDYLEIQQIRFQGKLTVREEVDADVLDALVPSLILQPLVENAIKHGVNQADGTGVIVLGAERHGSRLRLSVSDNGPGLQTEVQGEIGAGVGLRNTRERLEGLYGEAHAMTFGTAAEGGLIVTLDLPYHTSSDLRTHAVSTSASPPSTTP